MRREGRRREREGGKERRRIDGLVGVMEMTECMEYSEIN